MFLECEIGKLDAMETTETNHITLLGDNQSGSKIKITGPDGFVLHALREFNITGVHRVNPVTLLPMLDFLQRFIVTRNSILSNGIGDIEIWPSILAAGQYKNCDALPENGAELNFLN